MAKVDSRTFALLGKAEVTPGTDPVPAPATDAIRLASKPKFNPEFGELEDKSINAEFGDGTSIVYGKGMSLEVEFYLRSGGGLGVRPDFAPIIECANHNVTLSAGVSVAIAPVTASGASRKTSTFYWYEDGLLWKFVGAMATFTADFSMDGAAIGKVKIMAPYAAPVETAVPAGLVYQVSDMIKISPTDVATDNGAVTVGSFGFDSSVAISPRRMIGADEVHMDDRHKPMLTMSKASLGTAADYTRLLSSTLAAVTGVFGSAGNRITFSAPQGQYVSVKPEGKGIHQDRTIGIALRGGDSSYSFLID